MAKRFGTLLLAFCILLSSLAAGHAATTPQDQFLKIYFLLQDADRLEQKGQYASARSRYTEVADQLSDLKRNNPDWEPSIVNFRIKFARDKIAALADKADANPSPTLNPTPMPAPAPTPAPSPSPAAPTASAPVAVPSTPSAPTVSAETIALKQRISALEGELADTKKQLNDALAQAATLRQRLDAAERELSNVKSSNLEERMATILEENKSLKTKLADAEERVKSLQSGGDSSTSVPLLKDQLKKVQDQLAYLQAENQAFRATTNDLKSQLETAQQKLALADQQSAQIANNDSTRQENEVLRGIVTRQLQEQARRDAAKRLADEEIGNLKIKSDILRQQLDILSSPIITLNPEERALLRLNTTAVTPVPDEAPAPAPAPADSGVPAMSQNFEAKKDIPAPSSSAPSASPAAPSSAAPAPDVANKARVPDDMRPIAQQASDAFSKGQFDAAADAYSKIVQKYPDSLYAWSNLGVVRFQQQRYPEAEKALKEAIRLNPNDAFSHSILGIVYYQQNRFDEAIDMLTRATTLDPNDARTRNYLGIACSQKGWQEAAEKQLRKAVEIDPSLGDAHFNLAVIYATQKPPSRELARKHYQKALDLGIPKDPQLEKFFSDTAADASAGSSGAAK